MREQAADSIRLVPGQPISLKKAGLVKPMTRETLTSQQIVALLKEITPPDLLPRFGQAADFAFTYDGPDGAIEVQVSGTNGALLATLRSLFAPVTKPADRSRESEPDLTAPRSRIERLFTLMAERGASDLHLRSGTAPILRHDG